jgi:hypothetical protein
MGKATAKDQINTRTLKQSSPARKTSFVESCSEEDPFSDFTHIHAAAMLTEDHRISDPEMTPEKNAQIQGPTRMALTPETKNICAKAIPGKSRWPSRLNGTPV